MKSPFPQIRCPFPKMKSQLSQDENPMPAENSAFPPELQLPPPFHDGDQQTNKSHPCRKQPHSPRTAITSSPNFPPNHPHPIPPMPINYQKTTIKCLERKDKELKKLIASLEKKLDKLNFEKAHIESCLDYIQTDQDDFMQTVENYHFTSTPQSSPPSSPRSRSPTPPPVPPRPSFLQSMATSLLSSIPVENSWSWGDHSYHTYSLHYSFPGNGRTNECHNDLTLPESFALFGGCRTPSQLHLVPDPLPDTQYTPRKPWDPKPTYRGQCLCYDCVHCNDCMW